MYLPLYMVTDTPYMANLRAYERTADLVEIDEFSICLLGPAPRGRIEFVWKDAHGNRDGDAFGIEIPEFAPILPIETGARKRPCSSTRRS
jgi:hypothetical protein